MRRVLVISYHFPPTGGAGAQRPAKLVRRFRALGYEPVVVTSPGPANTRWTPRDDELNADIPPGTEVFRVPGPEPTSGGRLQRLGWPDPWVSWWTNGVLDAGRRAGDFDLVYAWMAPFESARVADALARERGVPWVGDLGDPWALDEMMVYPSALHRARELRRMRRALGRADAIVMSTAEAAQQVRAAIPELAGKPVVSIPNGFDADDFTARLAPRRDGRFRIVHTGYLHTELGARHRRTGGLRRVVGGSVPGLDIYTRSHVFLLRAVDKLLAEDPSLVDTLEVQLAGVLSPLDREIAEHSPVTKLLGYRAHSETVALLRTAELLFLPMHELPPGRRARIVPGKTYEYLAAGPPILAAVPDGDARDILAAAGNALLCRPGDVDAIAAAIRSELARFRAGRRPARARVDVVARYEYDVLAGRLVELFDGVLGAPERTAAVA